MSDGSTDPNWHWTGDSWLWWNGTEWIPTPQSNQLPWETPEFGGASLAEFRPTPESVSLTKGPADADRVSLGKAESAPNSVKLTKGNVPAGPNPHAMAAETFAPVTIKAYNGSVTYDGVSVTITPNRAARIGGKAECVIPAGDIVGCEWKEPTRLVNGFLQFRTAKSADVSGKADRSRDPYSVLFLKKSRDELAALRDQFASDPGPNSTALKR
jgi:hypothetical protein